MGVQYRVDKVDLAKAETISRDWAADLDNARRKALEMAKAGYGAFIVRVEEIAIEAINIDGIYIQ